MKQFWLWLTANLCLCLARAVTARNAAYWQLHPSLPPDKTNLWTYPIEIDGWTLAHDALRGEVYDFSEAINTLHERKQLISGRQARAMRKWWQGHLKHMQSHHKNEDRIVKAFVERRFVYPHFMEEDHVEVEHHFDVISQLMRQLSFARTDHERTGVFLQLRDAFQQYSDCLLPHLLAEEHIGIPLTRAYFTPKEVQRMTNRLARIGPRVETGAIVHYVGAAKLKRSMRLQNVPLQRVAWTLILNPRYRYYKRRMLVLLKDMLETPQ